MVMSAIAVASEIIGKIKPLAKFVGKLPVGGITRDRIVARRDQVADIFAAAGYKGYEDEYKKYGLSIAKKDDPNQLLEKKKSGNYYNEYQRLRKLVIDRLNKYNPGLGDLYATYYPEFMLEVYKDGEISLGQMGFEPIAALKEFVKFAPGMYVPGVMPAPEKVEYSSYSNKPDLTKSALAAGAQIIKDEMGNYWAINQAGDKIYQTDETGKKMASFGTVNMSNTMIMALMIVAVILAYFLFKK